MSASLICEKCGKARRFDADTELTHDCRIYLTKIESVVYYGPDQEITVLGVKDLTKLG